MPYEKDKNEEKRTSGKKSVTKKSGTASGATSRTAQQKSQSTQSTGGQSKPKQTTASKPKTSTAAQSKPKQKSAAATSANAEKQTQRSKSNTARDDYKRFSENTKKTTQSKSTAAKKTTSQSARRKTSGGSTLRRKGKSHSRSKLVNALTYVMMVLAFAALMVTLSLTVFFKIDSISVSVDGTEYYSEDSIVSLSRIEKGENIFSIPADKIEKEIEKNLPYVENCEIKRAFPTGIEIRITSAQPRGVVTLQTGTRIVMSSEGKNLEILPPASDYTVSGSDAEPVVSESDVSQSDAVQKKDHDSSYIDETELPEIIGLDIVGGLEPGDYIQTKDETALATMKTLTRLLEENNLPPTKLDLSAGDLYSYFDGRIIIKIGSGADLEMKIKMAADIILNRLSLYDSGRVDVSSGKKGYFTPEYMLG